MDQIEQDNSSTALMPGVKVAVLGAGKMGGILLQAFLKNNLLSPNQIVATVQHEDRALALSAQTGVEVTTDNLAAATWADVILLGVKPIQVPSLIEVIRPGLIKDKLIVSFAASVKTSAIEHGTGLELPVVRAMPNTPAMLAAGVTALCAGRFCSPDQMTLAQRIFATVGRTVVVDEKHMDAVTGLSGSGPAFLYIIIEALAEAGVNVGLPRDVATLLAAQTTLGSARMVLRDRLSSSPPEGRRHHPGRMYGRRDSRTRRRRSSCDLDQGRQARDRTGQRTRRRLGLG